MISSSSAPPPDPRNTKQALREYALALREGVADRAALSLRIQERVLALPEFASARVILTYIGVRTEVATDRIVSHARRLGKRVAAPFVTPGGLQAAFIQGREDLVPARFGLVEPRPQLQQDPGQRCEPGAVDLFVVPGLAFDRQGGRLGFGRAYYDRLLAQARPGAIFAALAFNAQLLPEIPMASHDVPMHLILTETAIIRPGQG